MSIHWNFFLILILIFSLVSCKTQSKADRTKGAHSAEDRSKVISLTGWSVSTIEEELLLQVIADFEAEYPGYKVQYSPIQTNYNEKIVFDMLTGEIADVFYLDSSYCPYFIENNLLLPLDDFIKQDRINIDDFEKPLLDIFRGADEVVYGLPKDYTTLALFYNPRHLEEAGVEKVPETWNELRSALEKLRTDSDNDGVIDRYGLVFEPVLARILPFFYQNGGTFLAENPHRAAMYSAENIETLEFFASLFSDGLAVYAGQVGAGWDVKAFGMEKTAMIFTGNWAIPYLEAEFPDFVYKSAALPYNKNKLTIAYTVAYAIPGAAKNPEGAWKLLKYLTGPEGMAKWTSLGLALPSRKSVAEANPLFKQPPRDVLINSAADSFVWAVGPKPEIIDPVNDILALVFNDIKTADEALKEIEKVVDNALRAE